MKRYSIDNDISSLKKAIKGDISLLKDDSSKIKYILSDHIFNNLKNIILNAHLSEEIDYIIYLFKLDYDKFFKVIDALDFCYNFQQDGFHNGLITSFNTDLIDIFSTVNDPIKMSYLMKRSPADLNNQGVNIVLLFLLDDAETFKYFLSTSNERLEKITSNVDACYRTFSNNSEIGLKPIFKYADQLKEDVFNLLISIPDTSVYTFFYSIIGVENLTIFNNLRLNITKNLLRKDIAFSYAFKNLNILNNVSDEVVNDDATFQFILSCETEDQFNYFNGFSLSDLKLLSNAKVTSNVDFERTTFGVVDYSSPLHNWTSQDFKKVINSQHSVTDFVNRFKTAHFYDDIGNEKSFTPDNFYTFS